MMVGVKILTNYFNAIVNVSIDFPESKEIQTI